MLILHVKCDQCEVEEELELDEDDPLVPLAPEGVWLNVVASGGRDPDADDDEMADLPDSRHFCSEECIVSFYS